MDGVLQLNYNDENAMEVVDQISSSKIPVHVIVESSVTSIGECAFYYCSGLTSITIPDSMTGIEEGTFDDYSGLTSVTIPDSVTSIGKSAFGNDFGLTIIWNGKTYTDIEYFYYVFENAKK